MRSLFARLSCTSLLTVCCALGCANRGMIAGTPGGSGGATTALGGSAGASNAAAGAGGSATGGHGTGGAAGLGGTGGTVLVDAGCSLVTDAQVDHSTTACTATFDFEANLEGATLLTGTQAFTTLALATPPHTYCGTGALAIAASFSGTAGATTKGEVDIPLGVDAGSVDLSGKTLTVHISASPADCAQDLRIRIILDTATGSPTVLSINTVTENFTTASVTLATDGGAEAANALAIEAFSTTGYTGTIFVDEIDLE